VLHFQYARGQGRFCVARADRDSRLHDAFTAVDYLVDEVDGASGLTVSRFEGAGMGVQAGVFREKGRVYVDDPVLERADEGGLDHPHEAGEHDEVGRGGAEGGDIRLLGGAFELGLEVAGMDILRRDTVIRAEAERGRAGVVGED